LHWLLAFLVTAMLILGFVWLRPMSNLDPHKTTLLAVHMTGGIAVLGCVALRLALRFPADLVRVEPRSRTAAAVQFSLYGLIILLVATGVATALLARLPSIVWHGDAARLPTRFTIFPTFIAHAIFAELLALLSIIHVGAALFHHFVKKDRLLSAMSFGPRREGAA
jgi:cytochrome b561